MTVQLLYTDGSLAAAGCFHPGTRDNEPKLTNNNNNKALLAFYLSDHHYFALKKFLFGAIQ